MAEQPRAMLPHIMARDKVKSRGTAYRTYVKTLFHLEPFPKNPQVSSHGPFGVFRLEAQLQNRVWELDGAIKEGFDTSVAEGD
jgi:hypothetical protein